MPKNTAEAELIAQQIREAFSDTTYPGDDDIVIDLLIGNEKGEFFLDCEVAAVKEILLGKRWQNVSSEMIHRRSVILTSLCPEGFLYYLPAFLTEFLNFDENAGNIGDEFVDRLIPPWEGSRRQLEFVLFIERLSEPQYKVIGDFLRYICVQYPSHIDGVVEMEEIVISFWGQPLCNHKKSGL